MVLEWPLLPMKLRAPPDLVTVSAAQVVAWTMSEKMVLTPLERHYVLSLLLQATCTR